MTNQTTTNNEDKKPDTNKVFKKVWASNIFKLNSPLVSFQRWIVTSSLIPNFLKHVFVSSKFKKHTTNDVTVKPILDENFLIFINSLHNNYHKQLLRKDSENRLIKDYFKAIDLFYSTRQF